MVDTTPDGQVSAYCVGGLVLDVPGAAAKSLPALIEWTLAEARLGQPRLHRNGRDADPVLVLSPAALHRYGLPPPGPVGRGPPRRPPPGRHRSV
ncbi:hypothetical protein AB0G32_13570 [Streptomyces sp. NPDC023723]|uniref:hypothetical protein n=1 Tax=Streptomyces sp. NPDC023723 TaxID=3154323 RepID=UPI0033D9C649